jgi:malic enzyme
MELVSVITVLTASVASYVLPLLINSLKMWTTKREDQRIVITGAGGDKIEVQGKMSAEQTQRVVDALKAGSEQKSKATP